MTLTSKLVQNMTYELTLIIATYYPMISLASLGVSDVMDFVYFSCFDKVFHQRQVARGIAEEARSTQRGVALRIFAAMLEPFDDKATQEPPITRAISKYGHDAIARLMITYIREPFRDFFAQGVCSFVDSMSSLVRCFGQVDRMIAKTFLVRGVHNELIKRMWKVIRQDVPGNEVPTAFHESLASISQ